MNAPTMSLYDIGMEALQIEDLLTESEGELTPELENRWNQLLTAGKDKIESAAKVVRSLEANAQACKDEAKRLAERAAGISANADRLKERIKIAVDLAFSGKVKTPLFSVWCQTSANTLQFDLTPDTDIAEFAAKYPQFTRVNIELNKLQLKDADELPECIAVTEREGTRFLRIK